MTKSENNLLEYFACFTCRRFLQLIFNQLKLMSLHSVSLPSLSLAPPFNTEKTDRQEPHLQMSIFIDNFVSAGTSDRLDTTTHGDLQGV